MQESLGETPHESHGYKETPLLCCGLEESVNGGTSSAMPGSPWLLVLLLLIAIYHMFNQAFMQGTQTFSKRKKKYLL